MPVNKIKMAYFAGFFDGEGCIQILPHSCKPRKDGTKLDNPSYMLTCSVGSTNEWILNSLQFAFGGKVYPNREAKNSRSKVWAWTIWSRQALVFLKAISPYLTLKSGEAEVAIRFQLRKGAKGLFITDKEKVVEKAEAILVKELRRRNKCPQ